MNEYIKRVGKFILVCEKSNVERSKQMELLRNDFFFYMFVEKRRGVLQVVGGCFYWVEPAVWSGV